MTTVIQPRYVRQLLLDLVGVRPEFPPEETDSDSEVAQQQRRALERSANRALWVVALDAAALVVLLGWRLRSGQAVLPFGRSEESIFTLGVIGVAIHLGFRLAQRFWLRGVLQAWDDLPR